MLKYVHHVHYVVEDRDAMIAYLEKSFGLKPNVLRENAKEGKVAHYEVGQTQMQITSPLDPQSGIGKFLEAHGPGVYHVAWGIENAQEASAELVTKGNKLKRVDGKEKLSPNRDGDFVLSIDPKGSLGVVFQLVESGMEKH